MARSLSGLGVWLLDRHPRIPAWPVMPAGRWLIGRHLGLTTSVDPCGLGCGGLGRWSNAAAWAGVGTWTWTLDSQATMKSVKRRPCLQFKTVHLQTPTTAKVRHSDIDMLSFFDGTMPPEVPIPRAARPPPEPPSAPIGTDGGIRPESHPSRMQQWTDRPASMRCPRHDPCLRLVRLA